MKTYSQVCKTIWMVCFVELSSFQSCLVLNYCDWISETMNDVLETAYPNAKYWKSSHPKHTDLSDQLIEQVIDPIEQSVIDFNPELQFAILQLLVNGVCDALLDHVKKTNYKYSIQVNISIFCDFFLSHFLLFFELWSPKFNFYM